MARKKRTASTMRRLHRSIGAGAAIFVFFMVLTGLVINHSNGLGLDQRHVSQPFLLGWYGLGKPENIQSYAVGDDWLSFAGSQLYLNDKPVATISDGAGAVPLGELLIAAGSDELLLLDQQGNLVERIPWSPIGTASIDSIGLNANAAVTVKSSGQLWLADSDLLNWQRTGKINGLVQWSKSEPAPETMQQAITRVYRGKGLSLERVLLDLHSGRIFGTAGVLVYDLLALGLGFLSISGLVLWFRSRRNGKSK
ncbi:MAG: PepSY-associated TM helix domain-containing protein [Desulfuromusa sp.]|nr:PepSY-associated TM helix domain-containing protein [Desulfuromusa sp.]